MGQAIDLSILIPARNEEFLARTVDDILEHREGNTEIIVVIDGAHRGPDVVQDPRVTVVTLQESIGQRAATNLAARLSSAKYVMKVDAHCAFDQGFDVKMMEAMHDDWTMVPVMRNLHVFDWVCKKCNARWYQGPTPEKCPQCDNTTEFDRDIVWIAKQRPQSKSYCFDSEPHFQYFTDFSKRPEGKGDITPTMSLQGSCFMLTREKYFELNICDESFGSWGSQGLEVAIRTWLSGGQVMVNQKTWYAHCFRSQGGSWGFPYPLSGNQVEHAKKRARDLFFENKWEKQIYPLSWLIEKFLPVPGWADEDIAKIKATEERFSINAPTKSIVYYTDNRIDPLIMAACQKQLEKSGLPIVSVSLKPLDFGHNIVLDLERGYLTMFRQILAGIEASKADILYFTEQDVAYHPSHFDFLPPDRTKIYYNTNVWHVRASDGHALYYTAKRTSQLCAYRDVLLDHYRKRVALVEQNGFSRKMGFEPASHHRPERVDDLESGVWQSEFPNIDIKHEQNLTAARWRQDQFRSQKNCKDWEEADEVPGWGITKNRFAELLQSITQPCKVE